MLTLPLHSSCLMCRCLDLYRLIISLQDYWLSYHLGTCLQYIHQNKSRFYENVYFVSINTSSQMTILCLRLLKISCCSRTNMSQINLRHLKLQKLLKKLSNQGSEKMILNLWTTFKRAHLNLENIERPVPEFLKNGRKRGTSCITTDTPIK